MKPAVGDVLEPFNLLKPGSLVHGYCPAVERSCREGVTLGSQRRSGETEAGADKKPAEPAAGEVGPQAEPDFCHAARHGMSGKTAAPGRSWTVIQRVTVAVSAGVYPSSAGVLLSF
jgi:hypothetical protein